ncbi:hypothetical protein Ahy_A05g022915 [Arachis hypogaea]|uniref:Uncharacterized protein n=1 Tax=Arachis hypogaea TaxID=3818 RepID=A0A445D1T9_ARAHY|nr:hypothetical protein Ahy_A05g022915 [Arachis hypogaea]
MSISGGAALHKLQKSGQTPFLLLRFSCQSSILGLRPTSPFGVANVEMRPRANSIPLVEVFGKLHSSCRRSILGLRPTSQFGVANVGNSSQNPTGTRNEEWVCTVKTIWESESENTYNRNEERRNGVDVAV